jgi:hypothetical protein
MSGSDSVTVLLTTRNGLGGAEPSLQRTLITTHLDTFSKTIAVREKEYRSNPIRP